ncbi:hypothetical protein X798_02807 [Onchocerca flexuosa]|uniref:Uncharacterized protein n=1 Tax=Onchocerca flexuosa TaxID=387005 RepID=A0A238BY74_9BILA|nr:hypothetical protein X798_02807 [Onchocerca flexuosa]
MNHNFPCECHSHDPKAATSDDLKLSINRQNRWWRSKSLFIFVLHFRGTSKCASIFDGLYRNCEFFL